jgi:hypothetical protein
VEDGKRAWEALFALWKDADRDIPALVAGKREARESALTQGQRDHSARLTRLEHGAR